MLRTISRLCTVACWCLLAAQGALAEEASKLQEPANNQCANLKIYLDSARGPAAVASSGVGCDRGYLTSIQPNETNTREVTLQQSALYGPNCSITITAGGSTYVIRTQQNYCGLQAGSINAFVVGGAARITRVQEGSFISSRPGQIWVALN
jgi:hypothetical protein